MPSRETRSRQVVKPLRQLLRLVREERVEDLKLRAAFYPIPGGSVGEYRVAVRDCYGECVDVV